MDGTIAPELLGLQEMLLTETPRRVQTWLYATKWAQLLDELVATGMPLTHALLDDLPPRPHVRHLRQALIHAGALPERDESLATVEPWVETLLANSAASHAALIRPYVSWSVLRRARYRAQRHGATTSAGRYARARVRAAVDFLDWLDQRTLTLATATQTDVERWIDVDSRSRYRLRDFLRWAHSRGLCGQLVVPAVGREGLAENVLPTEERWRLLRHCLSDVGLPTRLRGAGALVLLYGQTPSRIVTLTRDDISSADGLTYLALHRQPVLLPPQLADLVHQLAEDSEKAQRPLGYGNAGWLFPGTRPGAHQRSGYLASLLNDRVGLRIGAGRAAALSDLASELPAAVLAELLGISISTAGRWVALVKSDWTAYIAERDVP